MTSRLAARRYVSIVLRDDATCRGGVTAVAAWAGRHSFHVDQPLIVSDGVELGQALEHLRLTRRDILHIETHGPEPDFNPDWAFVLIGGDYLDPAEAFPGGLGLHPMLAILGPCYAGGDAGRQAIHHLFRPATWVISCAGYATVERVENRGLPALDAIP